MQLRCVLKTLLPPWCYTIGVQFTFDLICTTFHTCWISWKYMKYICKWRSMNRIGLSTPIQKFTCPMPNYQRPVNNVSDYAINPSQVQFGTWSFEHCHCPFQMVLPLLVYILWWMTLRKSSSFLIIITNANLPSTTKKGDRLRYFFKTFLKTLLCFKKCLKSVKFLRHCLSVLKCILIVTTPIKKIILTIFLTSFLTHFLRHSLRYF